MKHLRTPLIWAAISMALLAVFWLYQRPDFLVQMSNQIWACF